MTDFDTRGDPTPRTLASQAREIDMLRELLETQIEGRINTIVARMDAADKAIELLQAYPTELDKTAQKLTDLFNVKLNSEKELTEERFKGVQTRFSERDIRFDQMAEDKKEAINAAFASANAAVDKSEGNTKEQLTAITALITTKTEAIADKVAGLSERVTSIESRTQGISAQKQEHRDVSGYIAGLIGAVIGVVGLAIAFFGQP